VTECRRNGHLAAWYTAQGGDYFTLIRVNTGGSSHGWIATQNSTAVIRNNIAITSMS
jgi:hypothetical protein